MSAQVAHVQIIVALLQDALSLYNQVNVTLLLWSYIDLSVDRRGSKPCLPLVFSTVSNAVIWMLRDAVMLL